MSFEEYWDLPPEQRDPIDQWLRDEGLADKKIHDLLDFGEGYIEARVYKTDKAGEVIVVDREPQFVSRVFNVSSPPPLPEEKL